MTNLLAQPELELVPLKTTAQLDDGDIDFPPFEGGDDDGHKGCDWNTSYCSEAPTYRVVFAEPETGEPDRDEDPMIFCQKHYAAWLARWVLLHEAETGCPVPPQKHFAYYGKVS